MIYPALQNLNQSRSIHSQFNGYNHTISCGESEFYDMRNMSSEFFPLLSPRKKRAFCKQLIAPSGILDKDELYWVDNGKLYNNGNQVVLANGVTISTDADKCPKTLAKMGDIIIIMPDKVWYCVNNNTSGYIETKFTNNMADSVRISMCDSFGNPVLAYNESYYDDNKAKNGDYCLASVNGMTVLKQWSADSNIWVNVASVYLKITCVNIGDKFDEGDGITITVDNSYANWKDVKKVFINDLGGNKFSTNTVIHKIINKDAIVIVGIIPSNVNFNNLRITVERKIPDMLFITECNNRLWGCSLDGHEIYASKLGDPKNWNVFQGNSLDSWAATIGTDGVFTGAVNYLGYPTFFKENSLTKVAVSGVGAHQTKDTICRGVERGSERSLTIINEVLYYKAVGGIVAYDGSLPVSVSNNFGGVRYTNAVGGTIDNKYYISMMNDDSQQYRLFVYDTQKGLWHIEDETKVLYFCKNRNELFYIDAVTKKLMSVCGTMPYTNSASGTPNSVNYVEPDFNWFAETGNIGYETNDRKYVTRFNVRLSMNEGSSVTFYIMYDSNNKWEEKFTYKSNGLKTFIVPVIPRRCDHYKWKIEGKGDAKIFSITKITEQGSDI